MNRNRKEAKRRRQTIQVWTYEQAQAALPYLASILRSLRDYQLEWHYQQRQVRQLAKRPGRPDRNRLISQQDTVEAARRARDNFQAALEELHALDIYCLDPIRGQALIPFIHADQLAWFV